jgi:hypothetical protein
MNWTCPKCRYDIEEQFSTCWHCGTNPDGVEDPNFQLIDPDIADSLKDSPTEWPAPKTYLWLRRVLKILRYVMAVTGSILLIILLWFIIETGAWLSNTVLPWHRQEVIETACTWGGLAPLPESANQITVETMGGPFTRTFEVTFYAPAEDIENWIEASPRLKDNQSSIILPDSIRYKISPGEKGSQGGWVEINDAGTRVKIRVWWS